MIWIDIDDLIGHFYAGNRPTGIQRLSFDLACALVERGHGYVRVCRHGPGGSGFTEIDWTNYRARLLVAMQGHATVASDPVSAASQSPATSRLRRAVRGLPLDLRGPLVTVLMAERNAGRAFGQILAAQFHALRGIRDLAINGWRWVKPRRRAVTDPAAGEADAATIEVVTDRPVMFAPGDVLLTTGAIWQFPNYAAKIDHVKTLGVHFAVFAHDMVPLLFPEWSVKSTTDAFEVWAREVLTRADVLFANSNATAHDVARYADAANLAIPPAIKLPMGASFPRHAAEFAPSLHPRPFVLFVSTIEPRKNHAGILRIWRRLLTALPADQVPDIVFAGRVGWMARDVIAQAENADWFNNKLRLIEGPSDDELASLYRDCLFTVYPSFYEGWGLPITESLSFGKPVAASNRASIPEAGGEFCVYFDPDDLNEAYGVISGLILGPEIVAELRAAIAARFRPPGWSDSAEAILDALALLGNCAATDLVSDQVTAESSLTG